MHIIHKQGMFFHKLGGDTTFHNLENCNTISSKVHQFYGKVSLTQATIFH